MEAAGSRPLLLLRDSLTQNADTREVYLREKRVLAERHPEDGKAYTAAKDEIIRRLITEARTSGEAP